MYILFGCVWCLLELHQCFWKKTVILNTTLREATLAHLGGIRGFLYEGKTGFLSKDNYKEVSLIAYWEAMYEVTGNDGQGLGRPHPPFGTS